MKEKEFRKLIREEINNYLDEDTEESSHLKNLIAKFYLFIIKNDLNKAKEMLKNNPELQKLAVDIKRESDVIAANLLKNKDFVEFLLRNNKEK